MSRGKAPIAMAETTATEPAPVEETAGPVQVTRTVWIDRNGVHETFHAGQVVPAGREARELLERRPNAVARLDRPFVVCPNWRCRSPLSVEHVRTGTRVVEDAAMAICPVHFMFGVQLIVLAAGDLLELKLDPSRAREVRDRAAPSTFRPSSQSIFRVRCATCQGDVLVAIPKA